MLVIWGVRRKTLSEQLRRLSPWSRDYGVWGRNPDQSGRSVGHLYKQHCDERADRPSFLDDLTLGVIGACSSNSACHALCIGVVSYGNAFCAFPAREGPFT